MTYLKSAFVNRASHFLIALVPVGFFGFAASASGPAQENLALTFSTVQTHSCYFQCDEIPQPKDVFFQFGISQLNSFEQKQLNIAIWNIHKSQDEGWQHDYLRIAKGADILLFEEMFVDKKNLLEAYNKTDFSWNMTTTFFMSHHVRTGVANGAKATALSALPIVSKETEPLVNSPKSMMVTQYQWSDRAEPLTVFNIHGLNFLGRRALIRQLHQADRVLAKLSGPIVFAGDFNTHTSDHREAVDAYMKKWNLTRHIWPSDHRDVARDHVYSRGIKIVSSKLYENLKSSDHPLLWIKIESE